MNNFSAHDEHSLKLLYELAGRASYNPPTYTCIKEFTDSFPQRIAPEFMSDPHLTKPAFKLEDPYPKIYTKSYRKSVLSTL